MTTLTLSNPAQPANETIRAMKLRASIETDTALAAFLGKSQSTVASWRKRGHVPEAAIIRFESRLQASR